MSGVRSPTPHKAGRGEHDVILVLRRSQWDQELKVILDCTAIGGQPGLREMLSPQSSSSSLTMLCVSVCFSQRVCQP